MVHCWTPSDVLTNIDNSSCSITCIGYAPSQGRRCHNAIAAANRQYAAKILFQISKFKLSSSRIDGLLEQLAPRVLCTRHHQNQSHLMVSQWQEDIDDLLEKEAAERAEQARQDRAAARRAENKRRARQAAERAADARRERQAARHQAETARRDREAARQAVMIARLEREAATVASRTRTPSDNPAPRNAQSSSTLSERLASELAPMTARVTALEEVCQEQNRPYHTQHLVESQAAILEAGEANDRELDQVPASEYVTAPISPLSSNEGTEEEEEDDDDDDEDREGDEEEEDGDGQEQGQPEYQHDETIKEECSICLESLDRESDLTSCRAQCGQQFHLDCLGMWLASDEHTQTCPYW